MQHSDSIQSLRASPDSEVRQINQQLDLDALCDLIYEDPDIHRLKEFFSNNPEVNINEKPSAGNLRPVQIAAREGCLVAFRFLIEEKNANLRTEKFIDDDTGEIYENNLIEIASQTRVTSAFQRYIWKTKLWERFEDNMTELYAAVWCGEIEHAMVLIHKTDAAKIDIDALERCIKVVRTITDDDVPLIKYIANQRYIMRIKFANDLGDSESDELSEADSLHFDDDDRIGSDVSEFDYGENEETPENIVIKSEEKQPKPLIDEFCDLCGDATNDQDDIENFITELRSEDFDLNDRHSVSRYRPIEFAAVDGSLSTFKFLLEQLKLSIATDNDYTFPNVMALITDDRKKKYFVEARLWEHLQDGTTEAHALAWKGDWKELQKLLIERPEKYLDITASKSTLMDWAELSKDQRTISVVDNVSAALLEQLTQDKDADALRNYYLCQAYHFLNARVLDKTIPALQKAIYHHYHAGIEPGDVLLDNLHRCLATALSEISTSKTNKLFDRKSTLGFYDAIVYHKEAFAVLSRIDEMNIQDVACFKKFRHGMCFQLQNLAVLHFEAGKEHFRQKRYKLGYETFQLAQKTLQEGLDLALNISRDNHLIGVFSEKSPEPEPITVNMFLTDIEKISESLQFYLEQMPPVWKEKLTRVRHPKDEVEMEEGETCVPPARPATPALKKNQSLSFFPKITILPSRSTSTSCNSSSSSSISKPTTIRTFHL